MVAPSETSEWPCALTVPPAIARPVGGSIPPVTLPLTIPGGRAAGGRALRRRRRHGRRRRALVVRRSWSRRSPTWRGRLIASGVEPGDRVAIWAPNIWEWAVTALGCQLRRRRRHPAEHAVQGQRSRVRASASPQANASVHGDRLPRHELRRVARAARPGAESINETSCCAARCPTACVVVDGLPRARRRDRTRRPPLRVPTRCNPTTSATSSSRRARPGARRARCCTTRRASAPSTRGRDVVGLRAGDRYLVVNPFFHTFGVKAGILACAAQGRDDHPAAGVRRSCGDAPRGRGARSPCCRARRRSSRRSSTIPSVADFDLSTLRLSSPAAASISRRRLVIDMREQLGFETVVTGYGLTETHGMSTMCRHDDDARDDREDGRAPAPRRRGARGRRRRARGAAPASRARSSYGATTS